MLAFRFSVGSSALLSCGASWWIVGGLGLLLSSEAEDGVKFESENNDKFCGFTLSMRVGKPEMPPFDCTGANCFCKMSKKSCSLGWAESGLVKSQIAGISEYDSISMNDWDKERIGTADKCEIDVCSPAQREITNLNVSRSDDRITTSRIAGYH